MNVRVVLATLFVVGYVGFELFAIQKTKYRTEPDFIFNEFIGIQRASERCGDPDDDVKRRFARNLASVRRGAREDYIEQQPDRSEADADDFIDALIGEREREVDQLIDDQGCEAADVRRLVILYERRANLNLR